MLYHYQPKRVNNNALTARLVKFALQKRRYGYRRQHVLLKQEDWPINHKRIWRLYSQAGLIVRKRRRKRITAAERQPRPESKVRNQAWRCTSFRTGLCTANAFGRALDALDSRIKIHDG